MTINATRKIISLTGPNCSFANTSACQVNMVEEGGYTPTVIVTNQTELNTELAKSAAALEGAVIGVQYNATKYTIDESQLNGKNFGVGGLVICQSGDIRPVFSRIWIGSCTNLTLYSLEVYEPAPSASFGCIELHLASKNITIDGCVLHAKYLDPQRAAGPLTTWTNYYGIKLSAGATDNGTLTIKNCTVYDVFNGITIAPAGIAEVIGNTVYNCFDDNVKFSWATNSDIRFKWNTLYQVLQIDGDIPADPPHGDHFQFVGLGQTADWPCEIWGNVIFGGDVPGGAQGIFLSNIQPGYYVTGSIKGNVICCRYSQGLQCDVAKNLSVIGNTVIAQDVGQTDSGSPTIPGLFVGGSGNGGGNVIKNNVAGSILVYGTASNNHDIVGQTSAAYSALFAGTTWTKAALNNRANVLAALSMKAGGALDQTVNIGAVGSGYVDFEARTLNGAME